MVKVSRVKPLEEYVRRYAQKSLMAFLEGKKNLNWIKGVIRVSGILRRKEKLKMIFYQLKGYGDPSRYQAILEECKREGWM